GRSERLVPCERSVPSPSAFRVAGRSSRRARSTGDPGSAKEAPMASEGKKKADPKAMREELLAAQRAKQLPPDPLSPASLQKMGLRLGIPILVAWVLAFVLTPAWWPKAVVGALTVALAGVVVWALRLAKKSRRVAGIVKEAETPE